MDLYRGPCMAKRLRGCGAGHEYMAVVPNGDIYPCHQFVGKDGYVLGNVYDGLQNTEIPKGFPQYTCNSPNQLVLNVGQIASVPVVVMLTTLHWVAI